VVPWWWGFKDLQQGGTIAVVATLVVSKVKALRGLPALYHMFLPCFSTTVRGGGQVAVRFCYGGIHRKSRREI
jgi:hypothetical protein